MVNKETVDRQVMMGECYLHTFRHPMPESLEMLSWSLPGLPLTDPLPDISLSLAAAVRVSRSEMSENL